MAKQTEKKASNNDFRKLVKWFWLLVFAVPLSLLLVIVGLLLFGDLPPIEDIANPPTKLASQIISSDGEELGKFFQENRRSTGSIPKIPKCRNGAAFEGEPRWPNSVFCQRRN